MSNRPTPGALVALGLVTATALAMQVVLTRVFSSVLAYHFSFLAISLSLLGTGAGALVVYIWPRYFDDPPAVVLGRWSARFAVSMALLPLILVQLDLTMPPRLTAGFVTNFAIA